MSTKPQHGERPVPTPRQRVKASIIVHLDAAILCGEIKDNDVEYIADLCASLLMMEVSTAQAEDARKICQRTNEVFELRFDIVQLQVRCSELKTALSTTLTGAVRSDKEIETLKIERDLMSESVDALHEAREEIERYRQREIAHAEKYLAEHAELRKEIERLRTELRKLVQTHDEAGMVSVHSIEVILKKP